MRAIPSYELYGDLLAGSLSDSVHHETIKERSRQHDWTIRRHRHRRLAQIFLFQTPGVLFRLGDVEHVSSEPLILIIPPEVTHGFRFPEDVTGDVVSLRVDEMPTDTQRLFQQLLAETDMIFPLNDTDSFEDAALVIGQLEKTFHSIHGHRNALLIGQVNLIALYLIADLGRKNATARTLQKGPQGRQERQVGAFCTLLEEHFQAPLSVSEYASRLGISAPHLTRLCRSVLGSAPNDLVRQRRMLEAKRLLEYTGLPVAEIAHRCGFRDAAFFSRTFRAKLGVTPQAYRKSLAPRSFAL